MSNGYTPLPWKYEQNFILDSHNVEIARVSYEQDGYVRANKHLFLAAPKLLAALEELLLLPNKRRPDRIWEQARQAAAEARRETA